ncbi:hypothetical protein [Sphingobacterium thalpophilum]|uniref:hypothetical protein n=1 Tax=Sphingobacterium thalpophilum TaxID=259 RepID=UPI0024A69308|nr:hypothetical protein [Sphingobacterium thalpophilum]
MRKSYYDEEYIMTVTNGGLDIIRHYIPEIDECLKGKRKFSIGGFAPSSTIKKMPWGTYQISVFDNGIYWMTPINLVQYREKETAGNALDIIIERHNIKFR